MAESKEELESLDGGERGETNNQLKSQCLKNYNHGIWFHPFTANRWGKKWKHWQSLFSWPPKSLQIVTVAIKLSCLLLGRKTMTNLGKLFKSRAINLLTKICRVKAMAFPVVMYECELDYKEGWALKNWCFQTGVLEKTFESPMDNQEIKPVNPEGNQLWIFIGRTDAEVETPIFWPPDVKNQLIGKDPDAGKDWRQEVKGRTEQEMVGWHHWLNGHELSKLWEIVDREIWCAAVHWVAKSWAQLRNWTRELFHLHLVDSTEIFRDRL